MSEARVEVDGERVLDMGAGLLALVGVGVDDAPAQSEELARRLVQLRIFEDADGRLNRSLLESGGELGIVSQFTLFGDVRKGRRPAFVQAAPPERAEPLLEHLVACARSHGAPVQTGRFRARMRVALVNDGPVTILVDTARRF